MGRALGDLADPVLPPGFAARSVVPHDDFERRVRVHRRAWSVLPFAEGDREATSGLTSEEFRDIISTWPYRADLDWVVEGPDGEFAVSCCAWLDDTSRVVELEPVGTDPKFRGLGLGSAVCLAALRAARASGAREAIVYARGDDAYPVPKHLYAELGFVPYARSRAYVRTRVGAG
jgi:GNAT superfamily N-acetyltransferase